MQPVITTSLRRAVEIPCMIICSGTSRLVVIGGEHLPPPGEQRNKLLLDLMLGKPHGLGGEGSQANKVSVVTSDRAREAFKFHFYQIVHQTGQLMDKMECSNAAAAAGLFARLSRVARPRQAPGLLARLGQMAWGGRSDRREPVSSQINTTNTATGQSITLSIPEEGEIWKHPWGVRFNLEPSVTQRVRECGEEQGMQAGGSSLAYHIVPHGNLFVFCQMAPDAMTPELSMEIAAQASEVAVRLGRATRPFLPKIIPYRVLEGSRVEAASYFEGERHASMPGSASMALALFLRLIRPEALALEGRGQPDFEVLFQGGSMRVRLGLEAEQARWTEFFTPVRLLLHGAAPVPPEHAFFLEPEVSRS